MLHPKTDVQFLFLWEVKWLLFFFFLKSDTPLMFHNKGEADDCINKMLQACFGVFCLVYCAVSPNL